MIEYLEADGKYTDEALALIKGEFTKEKDKSDQLPDWAFDDDAKWIINEIFSNKYSRIAVEEGKLIGYLGFFGPWDGFFGNVKGAFSPLCGSAFSGRDRAKLASRLFEEVGKLLAKDGVFCYAISRFAHDTDVGQSFIFNGFGIRCSDSVMRLADRTKIELVDANITFRELDKTEFVKTKALQMELVKHLWESPVFFPTDMSDFEESITEANKRIFVSENQGTIIGYMSVRDEGETCITRRPDMYNLCGTFVAAEYRGTRIADALLEYVCKVAESEGMKYLGVDCETLNPTALRFWGKHFQNYTYSYCRRLDERVEYYPF